MNGSVKLAKGIGFITGAIIIALIAYDKGDSPGFYAFATLFFAMGVWAIREYYRS